MSFVATSDILHHCYHPPQMTQPHQNNNNIHDDKRNHEVAIKQMATMTLQVNCAVLLIVNDQVEMAERLLEETLASNQFMDGVDSFPIIRSLLYVYIRLGKNGKVLKLLQTHHIPPFSAWNSLVIIKLI